MKVKYLMELLSLQPGLWTARRGGPPVYVLLKGHYEGGDWSPWVERAEEKKVEEKERVSGSFGREKIGGKQRYLNRT